MKRASVIFVEASRVLSTFARCRNLMGVATFVLALLINSWGTLSASAQTKLSDIRARIQREGKVPGPLAYHALLMAKYSGNSTTQPGNSIAANASPGNMIVQVGDHPDGFGKGFIWDRKDDQILLVVFINAADDLGVSIEGLARNDIVQVTSASGIASFSEDKGNPLASSLVGLIATGAKAAAGVGAVPEAIPIINGAEEFAKDQFKATNAKNKRRDAYGVEPNSGLKARAEGGLLICLPGSGGPYYSGDSDHTVRWIKPDGTRNDTNLPNHVQPGFAFFANRNDFEPRRVVADGELYVVPWDWYFPDNAGFYKAFIYIKKGPEPPPVLLRKGRFQPKQSDVKSSDDTGFRSN
jgi:hypothetical protein